VNVGKPSVDERIAQGLGKHPAKNEILPLAATGLGILGSIAIGRHYRGG